MAVVLVALDGSPLGAAALPHATALAEALHGSLRLLSVVPRLPRGLAHLVDAYADEAERATTARLRASLARMKADLGETGLLVETELVLGEPLEAILGAATREDVAVLALATHARQGVERWALGSVADKAMRASPRPTLLVRPPYLPIPQHPVTLQHLLVPLDGSLLAEAALPLAERLLGAGSVLHLVRVEDGPTVGEGVESDPALAAVEEHALHEAMLYLRAVRSRFAPQRQVAVHVLRGVPARSLVDFALFEHCDLVVMTTRGAGGLRRVLVGSTADALVRSGIPTLLVRAGSEPAEIPV